MFEQKLKTFVSRIEMMRPSIQTEEATKTSLIMPFFSMLGYDVFNPLEFVPEYTADVGIKKGEKVDYAIIINDEPTILIEAKCITEKLDKHGSQLFRYFGTTKAKFGILTNGIEYKFFTDLEAPNKMDSSPFLTINLADLRDQDIAEIKKFEKSSFDVDNILKTASDLKYVGAINKVLKSEFTDPSDDFVRGLLRRGLYEDRITQAVLDKFKPIVKKSIAQYMTDQINSRLKSAMSADGDHSVDAVPEEEQGPTINTTEEEMQSYYIVKSLLCKDIEMSRLKFKDTFDYFGILVDGKVTKWVCRVYLKKNVRFVVIPEGDEHNRYDIKTIDDIYTLAEPLKKRVAELI